MAETVTLLSDLNAASAVASGSDIFPIQLNGESELKYITATNLRASLYTAGSGLEITSAGVIKMKTSGSTTHEVDANFDMQFRTQGTGNIGLSAEATGQIQLGLNGGDEDLLIFDPNTPKIYWKSGTKSAVADYTDDQELVSKKYADSKIKEVVDSVSDASSQELDLDSSVFSMHYVDLSSTSVTIGFANVPASLAAKFVYLVNKTTASDVTITLPANTTYHNLWNNSEITHVKLTGAANTVFRFEAEIWPSADAGDDYYISWHIPEMCEIVTATSKTLEVNETHIVADATGGAITIYLPTDSGNGYPPPGTKFHFKKIDASNNLTIETDGDVNTIDGAGGHSMNTQYDEAIIMYDGNEYLILSEA